MQFDPPAEAWYSARHAAESGVYAVCIREGDQQVVHVTRMPRAMMNHEETYGDLVYMGRVTRFISTVREIGNNGQRIASFDPMTWEFAQSIAPRARDPEELRAARLAAALGSDETDAATTDNSAAEAAAIQTALQQITQSHQSSQLLGIPFGVVLTGDAVRTIIDTWVRVNVAGWDRVAQNIERMLLPDLVGQIELFLFVDDYAPIGGTFLPPIPFGFQNPAMTFRRWRIRQRNGSADEWSCMPVLAQPVHSRTAAHKVIDGVDRLVDHSNNLWVMMSSVPDVRAARLLEEPVSVLLQPEESVETQPQHIGVIHLGQMQRRIARTVDTIRQIFSFVMPTPAEEDANDEPVQEPARRRPRGPSTLGISAEELGLELERQERQAAERNRREPTMDEVFGLDGTPNERAARRQANNVRGSGRRNINPRGQRNSAARQASAAVRTTAMRHGTIDWDNINVWRPQASDEFALDDLSDSQVWNAVLYCVRDRVALHIFYATGDDTDVVPECWLRDRPLFQALIINAVRRGLTFPDDVFQYLRNYVLENTPDPGDAPPPWKNPELAAEQEEMRRRIAARSVSQPPSADRRPARRLDL